MVSIMQAIKECFIDIWRYRYLLQNLVSRDFKLRYRRSVLGVRQPGEDGGVRRRSGGVGRAL